MTLKSLGLVLGSVHPGVGQILVLDSVVSTTTPILIDREKSGVNEVISASGSQVMALGSQIIVVKSVENWVDSNSK